jgi:hypothetical protein
MKDHWFQWSRWFQLPPGLSLGQALFPPVWLAGIERFELIYSVARPHEV